MSKDGDWIVREDQESIDHILSVLQEYGATYRFGAPLDLRWLQEGWSSHFEFRQDDLRVRTDFVSRPPRISDQTLKRVWTSAELDYMTDDCPFIEAVPLAIIKKTSRERDYPVVGELARRTDSLEEQLRHSRSSIDIITIASANPDLVESIGKERPLILEYSKGRDHLSRLIDEETRIFRKMDEDRLDVYEKASAEWYNKWTSVKSSLVGGDLISSHKTVVREAEKYLPFNVTL